MVPFVTCFNNLSKAITNSTIKVRCVHLYQGLPEDKNDNTLECVLHDSKIDNIWKICQLSLPNSLRNKTTNHQFRLLINVKTEMVEVNDLRFLRKMYDFKPFTEISMFEQVDDSSFFDVIGVITSPGKVIAQSKYRLIETEISDEKIKDDVRFLNLAPINQEGQRIGGEFDDLQLVSLEDLSCLEEGSCWVFGKIESVECHYGEWYYLACKTCIKKVRQVDNKYNCTGCHKPILMQLKGNINIVVFCRFRFVVNVVDHTSNASLLLWDSERIQLLRRNVADLVGNGAHV
ncbi:hypothetical protein SASPL_108941 [Salvia splendens]|uniref:Replication factor A1 n=1 Tax=Salvia splendens TaxID=180675 RepID=A0A8X8YE10_SALSN|nr:hypothetical protein SASPL_108941 [Salvia splendens]